jgi:hypothetical protein
MGDILVNILFFILVPLAAASWFFFFAFNKAARRLHIIRPYFRMVRRFHRVDDIERGFCILFGTLSVCLALLMTVLMFMGSFAK